MKTLTIHQKINIKANFKSSMYYLQATYYLYRVELKRN